MNTHTFRSTLQSLRLWAAILTVILVAPVHGQKWIDIPMEGRDTSLWFRWSMRNAEQIGLRDLTLSSEHFHLRLWSEIMAVDVFEEGDHVVGELTLFTHSAGDNAPPESYHYTTRLNSVQCLEVLSRYDQLRIAEILDHSRIPHWSLGNDGQMYFIEVSGRQHYSFRSFWSPEMKKDIPEARAINELFQSLKSLFGMPKAFQDFIGTLPHQCYSGGGIIMICPGKQ